MTPGRLLENVNVLVTPRRLVLVSLFPIQKFSLDIPIDSCITMNWMLPLASENICSIW